MSQTIGGFTKRDIKAVKKHQRSILITRILAEGYGRIELCRELDKLIEDMTAVITGWEAGQQ